MLKIKTFYLFLILVILATIRNSYALVDYTDSSGGKNRFETPHQVVRKKTPLQKTQQASSNSGPKWLAMTMQYDSLSVDSGNSDGKVDTLSFKGHIQTQNNIFLNFKYWQAQSGNSSLAKSNSFQEGNPEVRLGFNWMRFGRPDDATMIDIFGGGTFKSSGSDFGSTRNDKLVGLQTTKTFYTFVIGFGVEYVLTGGPKSQDEIEIGNITQLSAAIGWTATPDIRFALEGTTTKVAPSSNKEDENVLSEEFSFSSMKPKLHLLLSPHYDLELGAIFRTKKAFSNQNLIKTKLYGREGVYGNTVYAAVNVSI